MLKHLHLSGPTPYARAGRVQDHIVRTFLSHKAAPIDAPRPQPTIITAEFNPVYTCGRREIGTVSREQQRYLRQGLGQTEPAEFYEALRGGQTTFHGPGQLVAYPIVDLKQHAISARCYVHLLEECIIETCGKYGIITIRTENPGVWTDGNHKICALGVHLRRNISSHGIGLNISTNLAWFERIVACGLEGKKATNFSQHMVKVPTVESIAGVFVNVMAAKLKGVQTVVNVDEVDMV